MARKDGIAEANHSQKVRHHRDGPNRRFKCSIADAYAFFSPGYQIRHRVATG
jgi:hypothetical protein